MTAPNLSVAIEGFIGYKEAAMKSDYTLRNYRQELSRFSEWVGGREVTPKLIEDYLLYLRRNFKITHRGGKPIKLKEGEEYKSLSQKSIFNAYSSLSAFFKWYSTEFEVPNPFRVGKITNRKRKVHPLEQDEIDRLLRACDYSTRYSTRQKQYNAKRSTQRRDKALLILMVDTGMRVSEVCGADIGSVDLRKNCIHIRWWTSKGSKERYVYFGVTCRQALWRYLIERYPDGDFLEDEPLFMDEYNQRRISRSGVLQLIKRLGAKVGVRNAHPHRLRHTFAINFLRNGGNIYELQAQLGHEDLDTCKEYLEISEKDVAKTMRRASPADNWRLKS
jgi:integrase/recombinase XerD